MNSVANLAPLDRPEAEVKRHACAIIGNPFARKDGGGETRGIFCNVVAGGGMPALWAGAAGKVAEAERLLGPEP